MRNLKTVIFCKCGEAIDTIYLNQYASPETLEDTQRKESEGHFVCRQIEQIQMDYCNCDNVSNKQDKNTQPKNK